MTESNPSTRSQRKLLEIETLLKGASPDPKSAANEILERSALATLLFGNAPAGYLESKQAAELVAVTENAAKALCQFMSAAQTPYVATSPLSNALAVYVVNLDRPFIINTLTETIRELGAEITALLHPIVRLQDNHVSLSYLEIAGIAEKERETVEKMLREALQALAVVTDDFTGMLVRADTLGRILENPPRSSSSPQIERREILEFLRWLADGGFVFLGHAEWTDTPKQDLEATTMLGLYKTPALQAALIEESRREIARVAKGGEIIGITRLRTRSIVHRRSRLMHLVVEEPVSDSRGRTFHTIIGMLTSKARGQESSSVPIIRRKLSKLIELEQATPNSFHYKNIVNFIDHMPKEEAFRFDVDTLHGAIVDTLSTHGRGDVRISVLIDPAQIGASFLIVMPRDRFNTSARKKLQQYVEDLMTATRGSSEYLLDVSDKAVAKFYFTAAPSGNTMPVLVPENIRQEVAALVRGWRENVAELLVAKGRQDNVAVILRRFEEAFPEDYIALTGAREMFADISAIEALSPGSPISLCLSPSTTAAPGMLSLYSGAFGSPGAEIPLGRSLGILENAGLEVLHERTFKISPRESAAVYLHRFEVKPKGTLQLDITRFEKIGAPALVSVFRNETVNDPLNMLFLGAGLELRAVAVLRAYSAFLAQANKFATRHAIYNALTGTTQAALKLWQIFSLKFDPDRGESREARLTAIHELEEDYQDILAGVHDINQDRILRGLGILLGNTVRTNFYTHSNAIALKLHSEKTEILPQPRPKFEIFVSSPIVEGIHLRSSMVARGGLRWSDRKDDYRTEVLGLMKTQKIKNVVIVPSGAKGGFIVRTLPEDPAQVKGAVENAYREYIRALLSLTDNRIEGKVVTPARVLAYDGEDPYFVVAADKGTATFSDIANKIATDEFKFWLGDAFASGGSNGYDHKKYAITARGAWECTKRLFAEAGIDHNSPFSVVGIGDMSGDVFGNGLLLSPQMMLVAAFDHRAIFLDPTPDIARAYEERKRLFESKGSSWSDYRRELISSGGGVYGRFDKEITLTSEIRVRLGIADDFPKVVNGEQLISCILKAPVDLLWNGGIGTYVKAASESNSDVNDSTNDRVRINAEDLRAKVVSEGGNLGFTQRARVAFSQCGGRITTDAIDNSGGVDLSDHEVNLKILFGRLIAKGALTIDERNNVLRDMAGEVCDLVLEHNASHALALSLGVSRTRRNIEYVKELLKQMSKLGYLNRDLEALPDDEELDDRARKKEGLVRPEVAVCHAVVKMWSQDFLARSKLIDDPLLKQYLLAYFPKRIGEKYSDEVFQHPLAREIIVTEISNKVIDAVSISFIHRLAVNQSAHPEWVICCALAAEMIFPFCDIRAQLRGLDNAQHNSRFLALHTEIARTLRASAGWMVSAHDHAKSLSELVTLYKKPLATLVMDIEQVLGGREKEIYEERLKRDQDLKLGDFERKSLAVLPLIIPVMEMLFTSRTSKKDVLLVGQIYSQILETLGISRFVVMGTPIEAQSRWDNELLINSYDEIRRALSVIACSLLEKGATRREDVITMISGSPSFERLSTLLQELREGTPNPAALSVLGRSLKNFQL